MIFFTLKAMAPHSSTLAWKTPWTEEPGSLQSMGSLRIWHDRVTSLSLFTSMHWRRKWQPTPVLLPGESQGLGSLVGCRLWVAQSRTRLKWLSSRSSSSSSNHLLHSVAITFAVWGLTAKLTQISFLFFTFTTDLSNLSMQLFSFYIKLRTLIFSLKCSN